MSRPRWFSAQLGAREHYAVPRALHAEGRLEALYTDFWAGPTLRRWARGPLEPLAGRWHAELASAPVRAWNSSTLWAGAVTKRQSPSDQPEAPYARYLALGQAFARRVAAALQRRTDLTPESLFFGYDTASLEALELLRTRGITCVLDQIDLHRAETILVEEETRRWPGWAHDSAPISAAYAERREREWALARRVVVNSEFARQSLIKQGLPAEKTLLLPLIYDPPDPLPAPKREQSAWSQDRPLRVLFLGQVILRKGIAYLLEAARLLSAEPVQFEIVGPLGITASACQTAPANLRFHGRATRGQVTEYYRRADLFILPTLSDSFALTQLEALAHGLPVIATPNCGEVVSDGTDGWIVPPRDAPALACAITRYLVAPGLLVAHSQAARSKAALFRMPRLRRELLALEQTLLHP